MPRRVYSATLDGTHGQQWAALSGWAAIGGVILFLSALCFLLVVVATWTTGRRIEAPAFEFSVPLRPVTSMGIWDRFGLWTVVAIVMVAAAYAYPLLSLLGMERFGSPPQTTVLRARPSNRASPRRVRSCVKRSQPVEGNRVLAAIAAFAVSWAARGGRMKRRAIGIHRSAWPLGLFVVTLGCGSAQPVRDAPPEGSYEAGRRRISVDGTTETVQGAAVSRAFFARETARPMLGRTFVDSDYGSSSPAVAVLGYELWTARYGASPEIIGKEIEIDETPTVVVGVMPRGFRQPDDTAVWLPRRPQ